MKCTFHAYGHKNILAAHKKTLEFTKDKELSLDGDCIVGVKADFDHRELQKIVCSHKRLRMTIKAGGREDSVEFIANRKFTSSREVVLRFSEFSSDRTLGFRASKAAAQLDKELRKKMQVQGQKITVTVEPVVKAIIFDFDNTINDLREGILYAHKVLGKKIFDKHGVFEATTVKMLEDIDHEFSLKGVHASPLNFDRHRWMELYFKRVGIPASKKEIDDMAGLYWEAVFLKEKPMPHAVTVLKKLHGLYKIAVMTDSDGSVAIKRKRANTSGMLPYIDVFVMSDDVGMNKPNKKFYSVTLEKLGVRAEECVMVGDKPHVDLVLAKPLGMTTVWIKYGHWVDRLKDAKLDYVDHSIKDLKELPDIMNEL